jgi:LysR family transcriptional regulator, glycine cleavage system transcriptional activator
MKMPPLNALRAFDAVARLGGVRLAAESLFVTPGAISQQVRLLEKDLGVALLERKGRLVALTDAGKGLHANTSKHLRAIALAAQNARPRPCAVSVTTVPSFAVRWLVPRLKSFTDAHSDVEVRIEAHPALADLNTGPWDLAIREGQGRYPGTASQLLFDLALVPVASPGYARRIFGKGGGGWPKARLLHEADHPWWRQWADTMNQPGMDLNGGLYFSHTIMEITAATDGQGIALVPDIFVDQALADGSLVAVDPRVLPAGVGLHIVWSAAREATMPQAVRVFRDWVLAEAALHRQSLQPAGPRPPRAPRRR